MIDVIFLLLTFFVYCMVMMINAQVLPVTLTPLSTGQRAAPGGDISAITLDKDGLWHWNREPKPLASDDLQKRLSEFKSKPGKPRLFVAMEAQSNVDRGPRLLALIETLHNLDIQDFTIVGQPSVQPASPGPSGAPPTQAPVTPATR